jgi:hypothetical protein
MISGLGGRRCPVAVDKGYDRRDFVAQLRAMRVTPHVAQFGATGYRGSAIDRGPRGTRATPSGSRNGSSSSQDLIG